MAVVKRLAQLHRVVALPGGGNQVLGSDVLGEVDHAVRVGAVQLRMGVAAQRGALVGRPGRLVAVDRAGPGGEGPQPVGHRGGPLGGQASGGGAVVTQLVEAAVAGQPARGEDVAGRVRRKEASGDRIVDGPVAGHVEQRRGRGPAGGCHQQIGFDASPARCHGLHRGRRALGRADAPAVAAVDHRGDLNADPVEVGGGGVAFGVGGEHHRPLAGLHPPQVDQAAGRAGGDHAGPVVAREHVGPLDQAGRGHQHLGTGFDEPLDRGRVAALHDPEPVVLVAAGDGGVGEHLHVGSGQRVSHLGQRVAVRAAAAVAQTATHRVLVLDQQHPGASGGRGHSGGDAGRSGTGHHHVGMRVALVVVAVGGVEVDPAARRETWPAPARRRATATPGA